MSKKRLYSILFLCVFTFIIMTNWFVQIINGKMPYLDQWTRALVDTLADTNIFMVSRWITELGSASFLVPFTLLMSICFWWLFHEWITPLLFALGTLISHYMNVIIKMLVSRERPRIFTEANAEGYSFPSGHAMISLVCYGLFTYFITEKISSKKLKLCVNLASAILIFIIGMSRFIINVHYLTDVLTGFMFGFIMLIVIIYIHKYVVHRFLNKQM
ncbi:phosphatase PAP2 family protein [Virgibacillus alimentarius]|uniref:Undecaprenyl-diphosphatase n=1 Tax=Virgibacillus alimentarius TaxID=698769 RepID=A0ABS4SBE2_9BACI|nr:MULTISPECIES: phosphatase PAP2 family protein [Virgibacillus]MBP2258828.1 undecaprenyl-diphosphatase [Virgibacillus alimentarius]HLR65773.1 phosphatase PAP2 family protein [Virgibacillus sp.]